ncbi:hypothetical protein Hdeb2414_s0045g00744141 [Helianthus debilis subsp. tardiflorus]
MFVRLHAPSWRMDYSHACLCLGSFGASILRDLFYCYMLSCMSCLCYDMFICIWLCSVSVICSV